MDRLATIISSGLEHITKHRNDMQRDVVHYIQEHGFEYGQANYGESYPQSYFLKVAQAAFTLQQDRGDLILRCTSEAAHRDVVALWRETSERIVVPGTAIIDVNIDTFYMAVAGISAYRRAYRLEAGTHVLHNVSLSDIFRYNPRTRNPDQFIPAILSSDERRNE